MGGVNMTQLEILNNARLNDIKNLVQFRNSTKYSWNQEETRNFLFVYAVCLSHKKTDQALKDFEEFSKIVPCKSHNYIKRIIKKISYYCSYYKATGVCRYSFLNNTLIDMLNITIDEQKILDSIINYEVKKLLQNELIKKELNELNDEKQEFEFAEGLLDYYDESVIKLPDQEEHEEEYPEPPEEYWEKQEEEAHFEDFSEFEDEQEKL